MSGLLRDYQKNTFCMSLLIGREPGLSNAWCVCDLSLVHLVPIVISYLRSSFLFLCLCFGAVRNWLERNIILVLRSMNFYVGDGGKLIPHFCNSEDGICRAPLCLQIWCVEFLFSCLILDNRN